MDRVVFTIKSDKGLLSDIEKYTNNILDAVTFVDFETACKRLAAVSGLLKQECWIEAEYIPFPRPKPFPSLADPY